MSWRAKSSLCRQPFKSVQKSGPGGAGSEVWNRVYMIAPVKKSGRVRLSTVFFQNKYGGEYRHGRTTRFCSVWVFPHPNIKKRFSDFRATSLVFISHIFPPTGVLRTLFLILNTCYELTILVHGLATVIWEWSLNQFTKILRKFCNQNDWGYVDHSNISADHDLNRSGLHLNAKGTARLASNFVKFLKLRGD